MATAYPSQSDSDSESERGDPDSLLAIAGPSRRSDRGDQNSTLAIAGPSRRSDRDDTDSTLAIASPNRRSDRGDPDSTLVITGPHQSDTAHGSDDGQIDPGAKVLSPRQEVFAKPHMEKNVQKMKYKKTLKTTRKQYTCWRSTDNSKIFLGGYKNSYITVLHDDGREYVYKIRDGDYVWGGVSITGEKQLICLGGRMCVTVNITPDTPVGSELHYVNSLDVKNPTSIFAINNLKYGILCRDPSHIEFCTLRDILMDNELSNFESINIDIPKSSKLDTACATPDGTICVASFQTDVIYEYNQDGTRLAIIGVKGGFLRGEYGFVRPGHLYRPKAIQRCGDMLLVTCVYGDVHTYHDGVWKLMMQQGRVSHSNVFSQNIYLRFSVCNDTTFWAIDYDDRRKVNVYAVSNQ